MQNKNFENQIKIIKLEDEIKFIQATEKKSAEKKLKIQNLKKEIKLIKNLK
jgi:hypothetical protein